MRIYYAHPVSDYGTKYEQSVESSIQRLIREFAGWDAEVENPNKPEHQQGYADRGMDHFMDVIDKCDGCVFDSFPGGIIGSGVAMEVQRFLDQKKQVWRYFTGAWSYIHSVNALPEWVADRDTTRALSKLYKSMPGNGRTCL